MNGEEKSYIERRFAETAIATDPFPHVCIRDVLPIALYDAMMSSLPSDREWQAALRRKRFAFRGLGWRQVARKIVKGAEHAHFPLDGSADEFGLSSCAAQWAARYGETIDLLERLAMDKFRAHVATPWRSGERKFFYRGDGWRIKPHIHGSGEVLNAMLYFPTAENSEEQGTYFYRLRPGIERRANWRLDEVEPAAFSPFLTNHLVCWINSEISIHGTVPAENKAPRRYLLFVSNAL